MKKGQREASDPRSRRQTRISAAQPGESVEAVALATVTWDTRHQILTEEQALKRPSPLFRMAALALRLVTDAVPSTAATFAFLDKRLAPSSAVVKLGAVTSGARDAEGDYEAYARHQWRTDPLGAHRFADDPRSVVTPGDLAEPDASSPLWEHLTARGVRFEARVLLRPSGRLSASLAIVRHVSDPSLTQHELAFLRRAQPFLELALAGAQAQHQAISRVEVVEAHLTPRELQVVELAAAGATNAEISATLNVTLATVKAHLGHAFSKLGVRSRTELAIRLHHATVPPVKVRGDSSESDIP